MNRSELLKAAADAVLRDRAATHGNPEDSFGMICDLWNIILRENLKKPLEPYQVTLCLGLLKTARTVANPLHDDNWVDGIGYAACGGELATRKRGTPSSE